MRFIKQNIFKRKGGLKPRCSGKDEVKYLWAVRKGREGIFNFLHGGRGDGSLLKTQYVNVLDCRTIHHEPISTLNFTACNPSLWQ